MGKNTTPGDTRSPSRNWVVKSSKAVKLIPLTPTPAVVISSTDPQNFSRGSRNVTSTTVPRAKVGLSEVTN